MIHNQVVMNKHAYLILAHHNWEQLTILLKLLDDSRNDIYLHIDKKSIISNEQIENLKEAVNKSKLILVNRVSVSWGGYSIVEAEIVLLREATNNGRYQYYHLISGQDLPIKSQEYIHSFFDDHNGTEFIMFGSANWIRSVEYRLKYYWLFQEAIGRSRKTTGIFLKLMSKVCIIYQKAINVNRIKRYKFSAGSQWFSITDAFARYILSQYGFIQKHFKYTNCGDESLSQIIAINSCYCNNVFAIEYSGYEKSIMRMVDWKRGSPYTFRIEDYHQIMESDCLFARKFDVSIDRDIINKIYNSVMELPPLSDQQ